jgi:hypothetical protein
LKRNFAISFLFVVRNVVTQQPLVRSRILPKRLELKASAAIDGI